MGDLNSLIQLLKEEGIKDSNVLKTMLKVDRKLFVPKEHQDQAYGNYPIPIGNNATISQPFTVAFMLEKLELKKGLKVLEVGTGSGYNAALIAEIIKPGIIYTTEIIRGLAGLAKKNIEKLHLTNIKIIYTDGSKGYKKEAPYDRIIVTAACDELPEALVKQLKN